MKAFILTGAFLVALALEWIAEILTAGLRLDVPLAAAISILCLWITSGARRIVFAVLAGILLDLFTLAPMGTHIFMLLVLSWLAAFFRSVFSETDPVLSGTIGGGVLLFLLLMGLHPTNAALRLISREVPIWDGASFGFTIATAAIWTVALASLTYVTCRTVRSRRPTR